MMKVIKTSLLGLSLLAVVSAQNDDLPGSCGADTTSVDSCAKKYPGTLCTAVQGAQNSKCAITAPLSYTCGGINYGNCPTRGAWPQGSFPDGTICLFTTNVTCVEHPPTAGPDGAVPTVDPNSGQVICAAYQKGNGVGVKGIWQCFGSDPVCSSGFSDPSLPIRNPCTNCFSNNATLELCNGRGSCVPKEFDITGASYKCQCNSGWSGDLCQSATDNSCDVFQGCGDHGSCSQNTNQCECKSGWTGPQCTQCTADSSCNSKNPLNKCDLQQKKCVCVSTNTTAYGGDDCTITKDLSPPSSKKSSSDATSTSVSTIVSLMAVASIFMTQ